MKVVMEPGLQCRIRLRVQGHLLGSAYVESATCCMEVSTPLCVFRRPGQWCQPIAAPASAPERADVLVLESTYGDRLHPVRSGRQQQLEAAIDRALTKAPF